MSFLHKCKARVSSVKRDSHISHAGKIRLKYVDLYKIEGKNCRETNQIRASIKEGVFFHTSRLKDSLNHISILLQLSVIFLLLQKLQEILMLCIMECHDRCFSL